MAYSGRTLNTKLYDVYTKDETDLTIQTNSTPTAVSDKNNTSTGYFDLPAGTTAERPSSPTIGMIRFNTDIGFSEQYTDNGWQGIAAPPVVSGVSPVSYDGVSGTSFTISGTSFDSNATVKFITSGGTEYTAGTVSVVSGSEITATTPQDFSVSDEPLSIKVINGTGLASVLEQAIDCGGVPNWNTASGTIASEYEGSSISTSVSATDPDGQAVSYSVISGALPSGVTMSSGGIITGTAPSASSDTTYNFTASATDTTTNTSSRAFSIIVKHDTLGDGLTAWFDMNPSYISGTTITARTNDGTNYTGALVNGVLTGQSGPTSGVYALTFDGSNDYAVGQQHLNFVGKGNADHFSIATWQKFNSSTISQGINNDYCSGSDANSVFRWEMQGGDNMLEFGINNGSSWSEANYHVNMGTGWHHVVTTYDKSYQRVYIDGVLQVTLAYTGTPAQNTSQRFTWGARFGVGSAASFVPCSFANMRYYNRAINSTEVARLYNEVK